MSPYRIIEQAKAPMRAIAYRIKSDTVVRLPWESCSEKTRFRESGAVGPTGHGPCRIFHWGRPPAMKARIPDKPMRVVHK